MSWREWLEKAKEKSLHDQMTVDEMQTLANGFALLVEEHEAAGRMLGPECRGREERAIADHDRKWQDADVFLRGLGR